MKCATVSEQPQEGIWSIFGLGNYVYSDKDWAKKFFIDYIVSSLNKKPLAITWGFFV